MAWLQLGVALVPLGLALGVNPAQSTVRSDLARAVSIPYYQCNS